MGKPKQYSECDPHLHCPWASCRYNLRSELTWKGKVVRENKQADPEHTCALRAAEDGPRSLYQIADLMGFSHEYTRTEFNRALRKLAKALEREDVE